MKNYSTPFVSVIIPNYCHANYLDQRITSVLDQTYDNYELIILDDCSIDESRHVIEKYRNCPHVSQIVYNNCNSGSTFQQWDKGISLAKGSIIWIAESDDYCEPTLLEELVRAYLKFPKCVIAYSLSMLVDQNGTFIHPHEEYSNKYLKGDIFIKKYLTFENMLRNASSAIFSKEAALSISSEYKSLKAAGDYMFWVELAECGNVAIVNKQLNYFRRHLGVVTDKRESDGSSYYEIKKIFDYIIEHHHVSRWRKYITYCHYADIISRKHFNTDAVKNDIYNLWHVNMYTNKVFQFTRHCVEYLRNHYGVYI